MTAPQTALKGLAQNLTLQQGLARAPQRNPLPGTVLFHDTFDDGFNGWRDHYSGAPCPALSLTSYPVFSGSHALMLGCSAPPDASYDQANWSGAFNLAAIKNLSRYFDTGMVTFSCYLTHFQNADTSSLGGYQLMFDTQKWDNSSRGIFVLGVARNPTSGNRSLFIKDDANATIFVPGSSAVNFSGDNEDKYNFDWMSFTIDLSANSGLGGYHSCEVNGTQFDLTGLAGGHANTAPQVSSNPMKSFAGGLNFTVLMWPGATSYGNESFLVIDQAVGTVSEVAA